MNTTPDALQTDQQALLAAVTRLMEPLAALCLSRGVTIQPVEEVLRQAFVQAARAASTDGHPERQTSRISAMTGLTRREVARLQASAGPELPQSRSPATDVLTRWASLPAWAGLDGKPAVLPRQGQGPSFESLAHSVTRDVHPRTLLAELLRLGLVSLDTERDTVTLQSQAFVPHGDWPRMMGFLGTNVGDHLRAAVTNVTGAGTEHFEQALLADELSAESVAQARQLIAAQWRSLMATLGPQLQALMDADQAQGRNRDQQVRIGLYSLAAPMASSPLSTESDK